MGNRIHRAIDPTNALQEELKRLREDIRQLQEAQPVKWSRKDTTGAPAFTGYAGWFVENTVDTTLHVWVDGAWRQIYP